MVTAKESLMEVWDEWMKTLLLPHQGLGVTKAKWSDIRQRMTSELVSVSESFWPADVLTVTG